MLKKLILNSIFVLILSSCFTKEQRVKELVNKENYEFFISSLIYLDSFYEDKGFYFEKIHDDYHVDIDQEKFKNSKIDSLFNNFRSINSFHKIKQLEILERYDKLKINALYISKNSEHGTGGCFDSYSTSHFNTVYFRLRTYDSLINKYNIDDGFDEKKFHDQSNEYIYQDSIIEIYKSNAY